MEKQAQEVLRPLMTGSDIMFGSEGEYALVTGVPAPGFKATRSGENTIPQRMRSSVRKSASRFQTANTSILPCAM